MLARGLALLVAFLLVPPFVSAEDGARTVTQRYVAVDQRPVPILPTVSVCSPVVSVDAVCFDVDPGETSFTVAFDDLTGSAPCGYYVVMARYAGGGSGVLRWFCGDISGEFRWDEPGVVDFDVWVFPCGAFEGCRQDGVAGTATFTAR